MLSKKDKAYEKICNNPKNVRFEELDKILKLNGFAREEGGKGSHVVYYNPQTGHELCVPRNKPAIKSHYVKQAILMIEAIKLLEEKEDD